MLQMPVYREVSTVEPKVFFGLTWRQCLAAILMVAVCIPAYLYLWLRLDVPSSQASWVVLPFALPLAAYGWWRPRGLKPEQYLVYVIRHWTTPRTVILDGPAGMPASPAKPSMKER